MLNATHRTNPRRRLGRLRRLQRSVVTPWVRVFGPAAPFIAASWLIQLGGLAYFLHALASR